MKNSKSDQVILLVAFLAPFVIVTLGCWIWNLQVQNELLQHRNDQLRELVQPQVACAPVHVTCECPEYDEGWDDAQFAEGCDPDMTEMDIDALRIVCEELDSYGYIPGC